MKRLLKILILPILHLIRRIIFVIINHAIPDSHSTAFKYYKEDELRSSYNHFKKYFHDTIFLNQNKLRTYAINKAISNHKSSYYYIEFGVHTGYSSNLFSEILKDIKIYCFDSFEGLREDYLGTGLSKGMFNLNKKVPKLNDNCVPVIGWIQDTLPEFISENKDLKINFVHIDTDTYQTGIFILQQIKPYLINDSIIIFDQLFNFPGWSVGEYKALIEVFREEEYKFLAFAKDRSTSAVIKYKKYNTTNSNDI
tara:strand:+ start:761 stop:1519 length:759 start_codon:yes stop_codon:yes gene_type:complete